MASNRRNGPEERRKVSSKVPNERRDNTFSRRGAQDVVRQLKTTLALVNEASTHITDVIRQVDQERGQGGEQKAR